MTTHLRFYIVLPVLHFLVYPSSCMGQELLYTAPDTMVLWSMPRDAQMHFCCANNQLADSEERIFGAFACVSEFVIIYF